MVIGDDSLQSFLLIKVLIFFLVRFQIMAINTARKCSFIFLWTEIFLLQNSQSNKDEYILIFNLIKDEKRFLKSAFECPFHLINNSIQ